MRIHLVGSSPSQHALTAVGVSVVHPAAATYDNAATRAEFSAELLELIPSMCNVIVLTCKAIHICIYIYSVVNRYFW